MVSFEWTLPLSAAGIVWDIAGAGLLGKSLISNDRKVADLSSTYWDRNLQLLLALCTQRVETKFGLFLLLGGFIFQLLSSIGVSVSIAITLSLMALLILLIVTFFYLEKGLAFRAAFRIQMSHPTSDIRSDADVDDVARFARDLRQASIDFDDVQLQKWLK